MPAPKFIDVSVREIAQAAEVDPRTIEKRLADLVKKNPNPSLSQIFGALISDQGIEAHRRRKLKAEADRAELLTLREQGKLLDKEEFAGYALKLFAGIANRLIVLEPRRLAEAVHGKTIAEATATLQERIAEVFEDVRQDHTVFFQPVANGDSPSDVENIRVGGRSSKNGRRNNSRPRKVADKKNAVPTGNHG